MLEKLARDQDNCSSEREYRPPLLDTSLATPRLPLDRHVTGDCERNFSLPHEKRNTHRESVSTLGKPLECPGCRLGDLHCGI